MTLSFQSLWDQSRAFRRIFLYNGIFRAVNNRDVARAEALWWDRYPKLSWDFCNVDSCMTLAANGKPCQEHMKTKVLPRWKWNKGILYRYMSFDHGQNKRLVGREYRAYHLHLAKEVFGEVPSGYRVYYIDGNPFNLRKGNLILLSKVALAAVEAGALSIADAMGLDDVLGEYIASKTLRGRPKSQWSYNLETIAETAGVKRTWVQKEIERGNLDPSDLASVGAFCARSENENDGTLLKLSKIG